MKERIKNSVKFNGRINMTKVAGRQNIKNVINHK